MKYPSIHIEGAILSGDILDRLADGDLRGQKPADFVLDSVVKDEIARAWADNRMARIAGGSSEIMKEIIGRTLVD